MLGLLLVGLTGLAAPASADPSGTLTLTGGFSNTPTGLAVLAASDSYVLLANPFNGTTTPTYVTVPVAGGTPVTLSPDLSDIGWDVVGSLVTTIGFDGPNNLWAIYFQNADGSGFGSVDAPSGYTPISGRGVSTQSGGSADGRYVWSRNPDGSLEIGDLKTTGIVADLATLPNSKHVRIRAAASDGSGLVVAYKDDSCDALAEDIVFVPAAGGTPTSLFHPSTCAVQDTGLLVIGGGNAAWAWFDAATDTSSIKHVATSGGAIGTVIPDFDNDVNVLAVTSTQLVFLGDTPVIVTYPLSGGGKSVSSYQADFFSNLVSTGTAIVFDQLASPSTAGVYTTISAAATPTKIFSDGLAPIAAGDIAIAPGRVGYETNATPSTPIYTRSLTRSGDTLADGPENLIASSATGYGLSLSGTRTAYLANGSTLDLQSAGGGVRTVATNSTEPRYGGNSDDVLSGRRLLYTSDTSSGYALYDDLTGVSTPISSPSSYASATLWGNYLVWADRDGKIWRKDLSTGTTELISTITHGVSENVYIDHVRAWGNTVAWSASVCPSQGGECSSEPDGYITVAPGAMPGTPTPLDGPPVLSNGYVAYRPGTSTESPLVAQALSGGSPITVTTTPCFSPNGVSLDNSTVAWLDCEGLPGFPNSGTAKAAPLPHVANPPWFLGDPQAPATYNPTLGPWNADFVTSASLTTCQVLILRGSTVVRILPCNVANMALGEATASWDGTDSSGVPVAPGAYTWTLGGSNDDGGTLRNYDGSNTPVTGPIVVTGQNSPPPPSTPISTPTPTPTPTSGPKAPGAPSGVTAFAGDGQATVSWTPPSDTGGSPITDYTVQDSTDSGTTWHSETAAAHISAMDSNAPATTQTVTGLTNGTAYVFRVAATNGSGTGAFSTASAPVTPTGSLSPSHLLIRAPRKIGAGRNILVATMLTDATVGDPIAGATVQLFRHGDSDPTWQVVGSTTTNDDGVASIQVTPKGNATYQWRYDGDSTNGAATSPSRSIAVGQVVTIQVNSRQVHRSGTIQIYGSVKPARSGEIVQLQQRKLGRWVNTGMHARIIRRALPDGTRNLGYLIVATMQQRGVYHIRVHRPATSQNAAGSSRMVTIRVT